MNVDLMGFGLTRTIHITFLIVGLIIMGTMCIKLKRNIDVVEDVDKYRVKMLVNLLFYMTMLVLIVAITYGSIYIFGQSKDGVLKEKYNVVYEASGEYEKEGSDYYLGNRSPVDTHRIDKKEGKENKKGKYKIKEYKLKKEYSSKIYLEEYDHIIVYE